VSDRRVRGRLWRGATAGVAGVATFAVIAPIERALVGGEPPFAIERIVAAASRRASLSLGRRRRERIAALLPWIYGAGWGVAYALVRRRLDATRVTRVAALTAAIAGLELATLPWLLGRRMLRPRVLAALGLHVAAFSLIADAALELLD
jgi:hypothetical protein